MSKEIIYLEYSEDAGSSHKFYEVVIEDAILNIRYGRIGEDGTKSTKTFTSFEEAKKAGESKAKEKRKKGYEDAVIGVRQKKARTITRRAVESFAPSRQGKHQTKNAPILWQFATPTTAFGIFISEDQCWVGNQSGNIYALNHKGEVLNQYKLPNGVKCLVADEDWMYAGCDDGNVYDLSGKSPRIAYSINEDVDIYWLDIFDGYLAVSDDKGLVSLFNYEDENQWTKTSKGHSGWMVRVDGHSVYHGHTSGITVYNLETGEQRWTQPLSGVLFGWQEYDKIYAGCANGAVYGFTKTGERLATYQCDNTIYSCATAKNGTYVFAGDNYSSLYCFDQEGNRLWKLATGCGSALSMQYFDEKLYIVTSHGTLACIDVTEEAIKAAQEGTVIQSQKIDAPKEVEIVNTSHIETVTHSEGTIVLKCIEQGSHLRVRVQTEGYNSNWNIQFPKELRIKGASYTVDKVVESKSGAFYRVIGEIKKLSV